MARDSHSEICAICGGSSSAFRFGSQWLPNLWAERFSSHWPDNLRKFRRHRWQNHRLAALGSHWLPGPPTASPLILSSTSALAGRITASFWGVAAGLKRCFYFEQAAQQFEIANTNVKSATQAGTAPPPGSTEHHPFSERHWERSGKKGLRTCDERRKTRTNESHLESRVLELGLNAGPAELEGQWKALRRGWYAGDESFAEKRRGRIERVLAGRRRESHSGGAKREHGERAAEELLAVGVAKLGLAPEVLRLGRKVTAEKAALSQWLRERTTVSLRWVSGRLGMGHYSNAGRGIRKMGTQDVSKLRRALSKLATVAGDEE